MIRVFVSREPIDVGVELALMERVAGAGAVATFTGLVRGDDGVVTLELEHYPGATEAALRKIADEAVRRWSLSAAAVVHRVRPMSTGDRIVFVACGVRASCAGAGSLPLHDGPPQDRRAVLEARGARWRQQLGGATTR